MSTRNQQQIGHLAFNLYEALRTQKFTLRELTDFGEALYSGVDINKVSAPVKIKLFKVAELLDKVCPLPAQPAAPQAPSPASLVAPPPATPAPAAAPNQNGAAHHQEVPIIEAPPSGQEPARG